MTEALGVPELFLACVKYFELIQLGRNFEEDFESSTLLLRGTDLRLRRWGEAVGITDKQSPAFQAAAQGRSEEDLDLVDETLDHISTRLKMAKEQADKYAIKRRARSTEANTELETIDESHQITAAGNVESRSLIRLKNVGRKTLDFGDELQKSTRWALYKKTELTSLLRDISEHVSTLEKCFPGRLEELTRNDATQLVAGATKEEVATIISAALATDPRFSKALKAEGLKMNQSYEDVSVTGYSITHLGDDFATVPQSGDFSYTWKKIEVDGNASLHSGNRYGYVDSTNEQQGERPAGKAERTS